MLYRVTESVCIAHREREGVEKLVGFASLRRRSCAVEEAVEVKS